MIEITPIQSEYIAQARQVIYTVAHSIFARGRTLDEFIAALDDEHELDDLNNYQAIYTEENRGLLLVALDDGKVVGLGGIRKLREDTAELKRIWLLDEYHGQQIGFRVVSRLLNFAREQGYTFAYLETTQRNKRALGFYHKLGFYDIASPYDDPEDVSMEMRLTK